LADEGLRLEAQVAINGVDEMLDLRFQLGRVWRALETGLNGLDVRLKI
jgi:hypothetical protein